MKKKPFNSLWAFIAENPLSSLTIKNIRIFIDNDLEQFEDDAVFFDNNMQLNDQDLFRLFFADIEAALKEIKIDDALPLQDQLFDFLMNATDLYQDRKNTIKKLENEIISSPLHLNDFIYYGQRLSKNIFKRFSIENIDVPFKEIPLISNLIPDYVVSIPKALHAETFSLLLLHFVKIWINDDSDFNEETMSKFSEALDIVRVCSGSDRCDTRST